MQKIFTAAQIKAWDEYTITHEPVKSIDLMERACEAFCNWYDQRFSHHHSVLVVCGKGNNGGDGLAIARLLAKKTINVTVCLWQEGIPTPDCALNLTRLPTQVKQTAFHPEVNLPKADVIIDALLGSGLSRPIEGAMVNLIEAINAGKAIKISVDIPSGLFADMSKGEFPVVQAHYTATFQAPKLSFFMPENHKAVGQWHVLDIGLNQAYVVNTPTSYYFLQQADVTKMVRLRGKFDHKGTFGHTLIIAGSRGKMGANVLCTRAALRSGSGLVTSLVPNAGEQILHVAAPEAMVLPGGQGDFITNIPEIVAFSAIALGPGLGVNDQTASFLEVFLSKELPPLVLDADALNILALHPHLLERIPAGSILTPHPGEFKRLVGPWGNDFERLQKQRALAAKLKCVVVLKGAHTAIALANGTVVFNSTGNPAMATGGSGDVLTGIIAALLVQGYTPETAAQLGVFLHGSAGDLAAGRGSTIIASDIIEAIPAALAHTRPEF